MEKAHRRVVDPSENGTPNTRSELPMPLESFYRRVEIPIESQVGQLHQKQFGSPASNKQFIVYRGQGMDKEAFQKMVANKGGLISFNSFLSSSKKRSTSLDFAQRALSNVHMVGVLFVMTIDPARASTPLPLWPK